MKKSDTLTVEYWPLSRVVKKRWTRNAKLHDIGKLCESIERYGFRDPIGYDATLDAFAEGNGRAEALTALMARGPVKGKPWPPRGIQNGSGSEWQVPILVGVDARTKYEAEAYALDHNNLTISGGDFSALDMARMWDANLNQVLLDLAANDTFSVVMDSDTVDALIAAQAGFGQADAEPQIDRAEELNRKWKVKMDDLWRIGEHRLLCGDSTRREDVERVTGGEKSPLLITSPPYWVGKEYEREKTWAQVQEFIHSAVAAWSPFLTHRAIINTGAPQAAHLTGLRAHIRLLLDDWVREFCTIGMLLRYTRIWTKSGGLVHTRPESDCVDQHWEFVATFYYPETFEGQRRLGEPWVTNGIWDDIPSVVHDDHSAPFHVELPSRCIRLHTDEGASIFEPFCGSGTTIVACQNLNRRCRAIEISPAYCAVALQRMADAFLGIEIERIENGETKHKARGGKAKAAR